MAELEQRLEATSARIHPEFALCKEYQERLSNDNSDQSGWSMEPSFPIASIMERQFSPSVPDKLILPVVSWLEATKPTQSGDQFLARHMVIIYNAIEIHLHHLGISKAQLADKRSVSPYVRYGRPGDRYDDDIEQRIANICQYMPNLAPLDIQRSVGHHPFIDLIPFQGFRQTIIETIRDSPNSVNQVELCHDIEMGGLRLWGQYSYEPQSYELTEEFAAKWGYLFRRDTIALSATNFWRSAREEPPLEAQHFGAVSSHGGQQTAFDNLQLIGLLRREL